MIVCHKKDAYNVIMMVAKNVVLDTMLTKEMELRNLNVLNVLMYLIIVRNVVIKILVLCAHLIFLNLIVMVNVDAMEEIKHK